MQGRDDVAGRFFVVTGGPGAGKSTLLDALERAGHARSMEAGRGVIRNQAAISGRALPWSDPELFAELMLCWEMRSYGLAAREPGPVFFDRGVPDVVGYLRLLGRPVPGYVMKAAETFRYDRRVFVAPPWPEIFEQHAERRQTPEEAERTCEVMIATYRDLGYETVILPRAPVEERVRFVVGTVSSGG